MDFIGAISAGFGFHGSLGVLVSFSFTKLYKDDS